MGELLPNATLAEFEHGHWSQDRGETARQRLLAAGLTQEQAHDAVNALRAMMVETVHFVPTYDELLKDYRRLSEAYLHGRIDVRWVMCQETHDALARQYGDKRYPRPADILSFSALSVEPDPSVLSDYVGWVFENRRRWDDTSKLFGVPIRIDPAARRPMFEIAEAVRRG